MQDSKGAVRPLHEPLAKARTYISDIREQSISSCRKAKQSKSCDDKRKPDKKC